MWDFGEFYDSVDQIMAFEAALRLDFSPRMIGMSAALYPAPRVLRLARGHRCAN